MVSMSPISLSLPVFSLISTRMLSRLARTARPLARVAGVAARSAALAPARMSLPAFAAASAPAPAAVALPAFVFSAPVRAFSVDAEGSDAAVRQPSPLYPSYHTLPTYPLPSHNCMLVSA